MSKILSFLGRQSGEEANAERMVLALSDKIATAIGLVRIPKDMNYQTGKYRIISVSRCFSLTGWTTIIEINPSDCESPAGFKNTKNPPWPFLRSGTEAINLPPDDVIDEFFMELQHHIIEDN